MLVKLTDGTEITCTVDEYEELYVRGLVGKNGAREALQDFLEPQKTDTPKIKDLPKIPTPIAVYGVQMPGEIALYGCQQVPDTTGHVCKIDRITTSGNTKTIADYTDKKDNENV